VERKIKDPNVIWLIKEIIHPAKGFLNSKGLPLGNQTSQFFANVYLNDLDQFMKHRLKAKYYIRYVDDFVILHRDKAVLEMWRKEIDLFLSSNLRVELHPEKSKVERLEHGATFLGFRLFHKHRLLKKSNSKRIWKRLEKFKKGYDANEITSSEGLVRLEGWLAYAKFADTYNLRIRVVSRFNEIVLKL
jgi:RNA-directed DNA polymerase